MKNQKSIEENWTCTDPDNFQYGKQLSPTKFEFREYDRHIADNKFFKLKEMPYKEAKTEIEADWNCSDFWQESTIDLADYDNQMIREFISGYYESLEALIEIYGDQSNWIIAECIFEQESGQY
jgi:hypothetical protein